MASSLTGKYSPCGSLSFVAQCGEHRTQAAEAGWPAAGWFPLMDDGGQQAGDNTRSDTRPLSRFLRSGLRFTRIGLLFGCYTALEG